MTTLLYGDCLEKMKGIADKSVNLIICDLPYGCLSRTSIGKLAETKKFFSGNPEGCSWDIKLDLDLFWKEIKRIRKNEHTPCLMFCTTKFGYELIKSNDKEFRYDLVWDKGRGVSFLSANKMPMRSHEMIYVFSKAGANYNRIDNEGKRCVLSIINNLNTVGKGKHPTEKPLELYKFLIARYSKEGDVVLDPTFGSGNSGEVCKELKRKYIGIEKDDKFFCKYVSKINTYNRW